MFSNLFSQTGRRVLPAIFLLTLGSFCLRAQETWSLVKCIEHARNNSLTLKQAEYGVALAKLTDTQNRLSRFPSVNGSSSAGMQFGRTIDPVTNSFDNQRITFNSYGIDAGVTLYSGGRINSTIKQGQVDLRVAEMEGRVSFNSLALNIANSYLQILMAEEQLENALRRKSLTDERLSQTDKLIAAGTLPANDRLDVLAQSARDESAIVQAQNAIELNYLNLKAYMQLDPGKEIKVEKPRVVIPADANPDALTFRELYANALGNQPIIESDELRLRSAEYDIEIARSGKLPTVTLFGGISTNWSSASKIVTSQIPTVDYSTVIINSTEVEVGFPSSIVTFGNNPYFDQLDQNFGQNIGLNVSVPIYNNGRNDINEQRSEVTVLSTKLQADQNKELLKTEIQQSIAGARAAARSMQAAQKAVDAAKAALDNAEKRFRLGAINNLVFNTARNTYDIAETELTSTKYEYLFRLKVIDFYLGRELKID